MNALPKKTKRLPIRSPISMRDKTQRDGAKWLSVHYARLFAEVESTETLLLKQKSPEALHAFRVALRRTRCGLSEFKRILTKEDEAFFKSEFRWLNSVTAPIRDLDVHLQTWEDVTADLNREQRLHLQPMRAFLLKKQARSRHKLVQIIRSARYRQLRRKWRAFLDGKHEALGQRAHDAVCRTATRGLHRALKRVVRRGAKIQASSPAPRLHELRIAFKKLRYVLEFSQTLYPKIQYKHIISRLKALQESLGAFQDLSVQRAELEQFCIGLQEKAGTSAQTLLVTTQLSQKLVQRQGKLRREVERLVKVFLSAGNQKRFAMLVKACDDAHA